MARKKAAPEPEYRPGTLLDWTDSRHWSYEAKPCRYCGDLTNLRDSHRHPAHKTCAEDALAQQNADTAAAYEGRTL